jgi:hypothetical protein
MNWVSGANLLFPKNPRLAGAYAIHDSTISGWNDRFAPMNETARTVERCGWRHPHGAIRDRGATG